MGAMAKPNLRYDVRLETLPDRALGDLSDELLEVEGGADADHRLGDVRLSAQADARFDIHVLGSVDAYDPAGLFGREQDTDEDGLETGPVLRHAPAYGWIRYALEAGLSGRAGTSFAGLKLSVDGGRSVTLLDYRRHPVDRFLPKAVAKDIQAPRWALDFEHVRRLGPGEAVAFAVRGRLQTGVRARLADLVSVDLEGLGALVQTDEPLTLRIDSGWSVSAKVQLADEFMLVFSREDDGRLLVSLNKGSRRSTALGSRLEVLVELEELETLARAADGWIDDLVGAPRAQVDDLFAALYRETGIDEVRADPIRRELFDRLTKRLGVDERLDATVLEVDTLRLKWENLKETVHDTTYRITEERLETSFSYDYRRVRESGTVLSAVLTEAELEPLHGELLHTRIDDLLDHLRERPESVRRYLRQNTLQDSSAWGFSFTLGSLWSLKADSKRKARRVERIDLDKHRNVVFSGDRSYEDRTKSQSRRWQVDFKAEMPPDLFLAEPDARDLRLGLALSFRKEETRARKKEIEELLDLGHLWGILDADDVAPLLKELNAAARIEGRKRRGLTAQLDLRLEHDGVLELVRKLGARAQDETEDELSRALAGALPFYSKLEARKLTNRRRRLYEPVWRSLLSLDSAELDNRTRAELGHQVRSILRNLDGGKKAAHFEIQAVERDLAVGVVGQLLGHPTVKSDWRAFTGELERLREIFAPERSREPIPVDVYGEIFGRLQDFWHQELYVRALGDSLQRLLPREAVQRMLWFEIEGEDERRVFIGSPSTA